MAIEQLSDPLTFLSTSTTSKALLEAGLDFTFTIIVLFTQMDGWRRCLNRSLKLGLKVAGDNG